MPAIIRPLERATHQVGEFLQGELGDLGLTQAEIHVLSQLAAEGPVSVGQLQASFGHRPSTLTSVLDRLEGRGIVARSVNPNDRRSFLVTVTPAGEAAAGRVRVAVADLEARIAGGVAEGDQAGFGAVLAAIGSATRPGPGHPAAPRPAGEAGG